MGAYKGLMRESVGTCSRGPFCFLLVLGHDPSSPLRSACVKVCEQPHAKQRHPDYYVMGGQVEWTQAPERAPAQATYDQSISH
jgi:hypothetical protein